MQAHRSKHTQRGIAAIELGLVAFPLMLLTLAAADFGRAVHQYDTLTKSVRDAARYQSTVLPGAAGQLPAKCLALTGKLSNSGTACTGTPLLPGLTLSNIAVCDRETCVSNHKQQSTSVSGGVGGSVDLVTVTITGYVFTSMAPVVAATFTYLPVHATMVQTL